MQSGTLPIYKSWLASATVEQIAFVDTVYAECERNYEAGGHWIVETMSPSDLLAFESMADVRALVRTFNSRAADCRWGDDSDPEVNLPAWK